VEQFFGCIRHTFPGHKSPVGVFVHTTLVLFAVFKVVLNAHTHVYLTLRFVGATLRGLPAG